MLHSPCMRPQYKNGIIQSQGIFFQATWPYLYHNSLSLLKHLPVPYFPTWSQSTVFHSVWSSLPSARHVLWSYLRRSSIFWYGPAPASWQTLNTSQSVQPVGQHSRTLQLSSDVSAWFLSFESIRWHISVHVRDWDRTPVPHVAEQLDQLPQSENLGTK